MGKKKIRDQYDYENAFDKQLSDLNEYFIEEMMKNKVGLHYATKTIKSGKLFEVEIYPVFKRKDDIPLPRVTLKNKKIQNDLNERNSRKRFIRLVNTNFGEGDYWLTLTYEDAQHPKTEEEAKKNIANYLKRMNRRRKKYGLKNAKYIYITEWEQEPDGTRCHYHLIVEGGLDRNELEDMWQFAKINDSSRLHPNEDGIMGLATYMADKKRRKGSRRWASSKGLKQPKESVNHSKTRKNQVEKKMVRDYEEIRAFFERDKDWKQYEFVDTEVMYNKFNCAYYIRIKARERSWTRNERKRKEDGTDNGSHPVYARRDYGGSEGWNGKRGEYKSAGSSPGGSPGGHKTKSSKKGSS